MPKEVIPQISNTVSHAANFSDMTQPMGPLEQGDQAVVDAAHRLPEGEHVAEHADGSRTRVVKSKDGNMEVVVAKTTQADGSEEKVSTVIDSVPGGNGIDVDVDEFAGGEAKFSSAYQNNVGEPFDRHQDHKQAQAIKLDAADRIDAATKRLMGEQVQDPETAREMAEVEAPNRDLVKENDRAAKLAREAAEAAAKQFGDGVKGVTDADVTAISQQEAMMTDVARRANERLLNEADAAAQEVRRKREVEAGRTDDDEHTRLAAEAEDVTRDMADESERRAAEARAAGHDAVAAVHDVFAQGERTAGEQAAADILSRGEAESKPPESPEATS